MQAATPFTLSISRYKEIQESKKTVVYYILDIHKKDSENWKLEKRYSEFVDLHNNLKKSYSNLPHFPAKTLFPLKSGPELEKRRQELEHYLQIIVTRADIMDCDALKQFLEIDNYAPEEATNPPKLISDITGLSLGVRDFYLDSDEGLFFTALSEMSVTSRVDSYISNIKMPWDHKDKDENAKVVGLIECYIATGQLLDFKFEKLWTKSFQTQVITIYWDPASCLLVIGKDDGGITVLKVSSELKYSKYDEVVSNRVHSARVMGVYLDSISEFIYSVGEDSKLKVYDLRKNELIEDISCGNALLTAIVPDKENQRIFISNRSGQVFIYDISSSTPKHVHTVQAHSKGSIRGIYFDSYKNYLLTSNYDEGLIAVIDLQKPERVKFAQTITHLRGKKKIRCILWSSTKGEIYTGGEDGSLAFWDIRKTSPVYVMKPHQTGITKLQYLNNNNILITGGKDARIRFYKLPQEWTDKLEGEVGKDIRGGSLFQNSNKNIPSNFSKSVMEPKKYSGILDDSGEENWGK